MAIGQGGAAGELVSEWSPTRRTWFAWWGFGLVLATLGGLGYELAAGHGQLPSSFEVNIVLTLVLAFALAAIHEGIHGVVMLAFGAKPLFGVLRQGSFPVGFYATAPGHRFAKRAYLLVALAPTLIIVPLGIPACWSPMGWALWVPFAAHLGGCVGDLTIAAKVWAVPADSMVEDLRDGMRIWRSASLG